MRLFFALICFAAVACAQTSTPAITSVSPNPIDAGGPAFTLTVNVSTFVSGAVDQLVRYPPGHHRRQ